jgi:hypothetical protein
MNKWDYSEMESSDGPHHSGRKINKERFCKKNKLGHGRYGPHIYEDKKHCKLCGKIFPGLKRRPGMQIENIQE